MSKIINLFIFSFLLLSCNTEETATQSSPPKVQVVSLDQQEVTLEKDFVGQVYGYNDIPIRTRVAGVLENFSP
ncbi:MAG: hypothetical protein KGY51_03185, partial [Psychroflexus sp.]|nr:hypothetical protein [Psychroflexus sp.]